MRFIWPYAAIMAIVFFGALVTGYISAANFPSMADALRESFSSRFESLLTMDPFSIMFAIFLNNAFVSLLFLVLGLALGVLPVMFIAFNGYLVGVIAYLAAQERGTLFTRPSPAWNTGTAYGLPGCGHRAPTRVPGILCPYRQAYTNQKGV